MGKLLPTTDRIVHEGNNTGVLRNPTSKRLKRPSANLTVYPTCITRKRKMQGTKANKLLDIY